LAREAAADDFRETFGKIDGANVSKVGDIGPVLSEDAGAVVIDLAEGDGAHPGSFEPEAETANPAE
jgi:hypothetical protein